MINYGDLVQLLLSGTVTTLEIFFLVLVLSVPLGLLVSFGRMSKFKIINTPVRIYILIMRGTPLILQIVAVYFLIPFNALFGDNGRFIAVIAAFTINYSAYFAEIFRSGITSIDKGQYEAGKVLGYTKSQTFIRLIMPQVAFVIMPVVCSEVMTLVKDTALASVIGTVELFKTSWQQSSFYTNIIPVFIAGVFYFIMNSVVELSFHRLEKVFSHGRKA